MLARWGSFPTSARPRLRCAAAAAVHVTNHFSRLKWSPAGASKGHLFSPGPPLAQARARIQGAQIDFSPGMAFGTLAAPPGDLSGPLGPMMGRDGSPWGSIGILAGTP